MPEGQDKSSTKDGRDGGLPRSTQDRSGRRMSARADAFATQLQDALRKAAAAQEQQEKQEKKEKQKQEGDSAGKKCLLLEKPIEGSPGSAWFGGG